LLRDARFRLLLAGETINSIGGWASAIVLWGFAAFRFGASPQQVSLTIVCWAAPPALLSPLAGVYVDRLGPARAVIAGYLGAAAAALGMAAAGSLTVLDLAAVGYGMARALAGPAAGALPPRVVADEDLLAANALLGAAASAGQVAGPLAAGAALALSGFPAAFVLDAVSYLIGAAVVAPLRLRPLPDRQRADQPGWKHQLATGVRLVVARSGLRRGLLLSAAVTFTSAAYLVVEPLYARHVLHRPPSQFALFEAAAGAGSILTGLAISRYRTRLAGPAPAGGRSGGLRPGRGVVHRHHPDTGGLRRRVRLGHGWRAVRRGRDDHAAAAGPGQRPRPGHGSQRDPPVLGGDHRAAAGRGDPGRPGHPRRGTGPGRRGHRRRSDRAGQPPDRR
jgi:MFS family permease